MSHRPPPSAGAAPTGAQVRAGSRRQYRWREIIQTEQKACFYLSTEQFVSAVTRLCVSYPGALTVCVRVCVCLTSVGVWPEGESPSILCSAPQWCTGQDGGQSPQPLRCSGGMCRHRAGKRSVCVLQRRCSKPRSSSPTSQPSVSAGNQNTLSFPPDKYAVRFIPRENGVHSIDVKFNGSHIPGSPFQVRVGEPGQTGEPSLVSAHGAGLERGTTGGSPDCSPDSCYF